MTDIKTSDVFAWAIISLPVLHACFWIGYQAEAAYVWLAGWL